MNIYRAVCASTGSIGQRFAADRLAGILGQNFQELCFAICQTDQLVTVFKLFPCQIKYEARHFDFLDRLLNNNTAEYGGNAQCQFFRFERLGEVVVSAKLQAFNAVGRIAARRQHDDGRGFVRLAQMLQQLEPVYLWHHHV